ncbi:hypothetical protein VNI00_013133 [Paramarasmius palmivorus]|uniref:Uncharacterized protein n=1 Tax=Paramarasmius palmivorus TaxID=297713 RepID=A0AAW0C127_9AGAR
MVNLFLGNLGHMALELLLGDPPQFQQVNDADNVKTEVKNSCIRKYMQTVLWFLVLGLWDTFRVLQFETGAIIVGACALGMFTVPNSDAPLEIIVQAKYVSRLLMFFLKAGFVFMPSRPEHEWPDDHSDIIWMEDSFSNTFRANKNTYSPLVDHALVANVYNFCDSSQRRVQIVASNGSAFDLMFAMTSTIYMNLVTATHMVMLFPYTTLERRVSIDFTRPQGVNTTLTMPYFKGDAVKVNPPLTALDVVVPTSEVNLLPRSLLAPPSLCVELPPVPLPYGVNYPGSPELAAAVSWQMGVDASHFASIETVPYRHHTLLQSYTLAPVVELAVTRPRSGFIEELSSEETDQDVGDLHHDVASMEEAADEEFMATLDGILTDTLGVRSRYRHNASVIATCVAEWCGFGCSTSTALAPTAAVASAAFATLNSLPPVNPELIRITMVCSPTRGLNGRIWTTLTVCFLEEREATEDSEQSVAEDHKHVLAGLANIAMTIRIFAENRRDIQIGL